MVLSLAKQELPPVILLANPTGADGAAQGMAGPADGKPTPENMMKPMTEGEYVTISSAGGGCALRVEPVEAGAADGLAMEPESMEAAGLTAEMLAKYNQPKWRAVVQMSVPSDDVRETVLFATNLTKRLAALGDGIIMDVCACRFFGPAGWEVNEPLPDFDAREHVHVHIVQDGNASWFHTHGLVKFGRPELEIYDVPAEMDELAYGMLFDLSQYIITSAQIEPGQTCGDPNQPFYAREGTKNEKDHWEGTPVLELVDLNESGRPIASGAPKALQAFAAIREEQ